MSWSDFLFTYWEICFGYWLFTSHGVIKLCAFYCSLHIFHAHRLSLSKLGANFFLKPAIGFIVALKWLHCWEFSPLIQIGFYGSRRELLLTHSVSAEHLQGSALCNGLICRPSQHAVNAFLQEAAAALLLCRLLGQGPQFSVISVRHAGETLAEPAANTRMSVVCSEQDEDFRCFIVRIQSLFTILLSYCFNFILLLLIFFAVHI